MTLQLIYYLNVIVFMGYWLVVCRCWLFSCYISNQSVWKITKFQIVPSKHNTIDARMSLVPVHHLIQKNLVSTYSRALNNRLPSMPFAIVDDRLSANKDTTEPARKSPRTSKSCLSSTFTGLNNTYICDRENAIGENLEAEDDSDDESGSDALPIITAAAQCSLEWNHNADDSVASSAVAPDRSSLSKNLSLQGSFKKPLPKDIPLLLQRRYTKTNGLYCWDIDKLFQLFSFVFGFSSLWGIWDLVAYLC